VCAHGLQQQLAIAFDGGPGIIAREAQVQRISTIRFRRSPGTSGEAVNQPGQVQPRMTQQLQSGVSGRGVRR